MINFKTLRFDPAHHLGLGDIRLALDQQEQVASEFNHLLATLDHIEKMLHSAANGGTRTARMPTRVGDLKAVMRAARDKARAAILKITKPISNCDACGGNGTVYTINESEIDQTPGSSARLCPLCGEPND